MRNGDIFEYEVSTFDGSKQHQIKFKFSACNTHKDRIDQQIEPKKQTIRIISRQNKT